MCSVFGVLQIFTPKLYLLTLSYKYSGPHRVHQTQLHSLVWILLKRTLSQNMIWQIGLEKCISKLFDIAAQTLKKLPRGNSNLSEMNDSCPIHESLVLYKLYSFISFRARKKPQRSSTLTHVINKKRKAQGNQETRPRSLLSLWWRQTNSQSLVQPLGGAIFEY